MEISGFSAYNGGISGKISAGKYIGVINREKLPIKFNKIIDYMRRENLKEYLTDPQIVSSSNITLIVGRLKKGVNPDEVFKKDLSYLNNLFKKAPILAMEPNDKLAPYTPAGFSKAEGQKQIGHAEGLIKVSGNDLIVETNDKNILALSTNALENKKGIKLPATEENKKKLLFAMNPGAGRWQVEGEETMKHMATTLHRLADIIPLVHYGELTPELSKKGFDTFKGHLSNSLGLKIQ